jgi:hypothetical protein
MTLLIGLVIILLLSKTHFKMKDKKKEVIKPPQEEKKVTYTDWIRHDYVNQLWEWDTLKTIKS